MNIYNAFLYIIIGLYIHIFIYIFLYKTYFIGIIRNLQWAFLSVELVADQNYHESLWRRAIFATKIENQSWLTTSPLIGIDKRRNISAFAPTIIRHLADFVDGKRILSTRSRHDFAAISKIFRDAVFLTIAKCSSPQSFFT